MTRTIYLVSFVAVSQKKKDKKKKNEVMKRVLEV